MQRKLLKLQQLAKQGGRCAQCERVLPEKGAVLDRFDPMLGYTLDDTRLVCPGCNIRTQEERRYAG